MLTESQALAIMPLAKARIARFIEPINATLDEYNIDTTRRRSAFLAQIAHESGSLRYVCELASGAAYDNRADLGNTRPEAIHIAAMHGTSPGRFWRGHGLIQITGFTNHGLCGLALGADFTNQPELLELPIYAARSAGWFWQVNDIARFADADDFDGVCDAVNRGHKTVKYGDANGFKERLAFYQRALEVLG